MQDSLVQRLRDRAYSFKAPDPLMEEAANEIERLRLTDEEREAIEDAAHLCESSPYPLTQQDGATLRDLLRRTTL
jgi:hypothetical protein